MKPIPDTDNALVLRTDFSDSDAWDTVCAAIRTPVDGFQAYVEFVSDPVYGGLTTAQILALIPPGSNHTFMFIVDRITLTQPEYPILVVDLYDEPGRTFRVIPAGMWAVENNLSIANMDFEEFADEVDDDGIFRGGFPS